MRSVSSLLSLSSLPLSSFFSLSLFLHIIFMVGQFNERLITLELHKNYPLFNVLVLDAAPKRWKGRDRKEGKSNQTRRKREKEGREKRKGKERERRRRKRTQFTSSSLGWNLFPSFFSSFQR